MDEANILSPGFEQEMNVKLGAYERATKHQLVVFTTAGMASQPVDQYSLSLANRLKIGRKDYNDGLMLLVAPAERKVRIEVGKGMETAITNAEADQIIVTSILPEFRKNNFASGISHGVDAMMKEAP